VQGPFATVQCGGGAAAAATAAAAEKEEEDAPFLLSDEQWSQLLVPNTLFPDFNAFGTYTLGLWWEPGGWRSMDKRQKSMENSTCTGIPGISTVDFQLL
jgi:hypothetical protein